MSKNLCPVCRKRVIQAQAHITIGEDGGKREIFHLNCWLDLQYAEELGIRPAMTPEGAK